MRNIEAATIGAILINPKSFANIQGIVRVDDFHSELNRTVWRAIQEISAQGILPDLLTVAEHLRKSGQLDAIGGAVALSALTEFAEYSGNLDQYAESIAKAGREREMREAILDASDSVKEGENAEEVSGQLISELEAIGRLDNITQAKPIKEIVKDCMNPEKSMDYVKTGYQQLDNAHGGGLEPGTVTIIGAAPSIGKSQLAINISAQATRADGQQARILYISLEMSDAMLFERLCGACGNMLLATVRVIRNQTAKDYTLESSVDKLLESAERVYSLPLLVYDKRTINCDEFRRIVARYHSQVDLVILDYLQLMRGEKNQSRLETVEAGSKACKELAKRYRLPIIAIASLNREGYKEDGTRPNLAHLKQCGDIEYDSDNVWMLYREKKDARKEDLELYIRKQRQGAIDNMNFAYNLETGRITEGLPEIPDE